MKDVLKPYFDWIQDPKVVLSEGLKVVGLTSAYSKTDSELLEVYREKLHRELEEQCYALLDLVFDHFIWQNEQTYEQVRKAILTPLASDENNYESAIKGLTIGRTSTAGPKRRKFTQNPNR